MDYVVLDRYFPGIETPYCVHGRSMCIACGHVVLLGSKTYQAVKNDGCLPICIECANVYAPPQCKPVTRFKDHLRSDGPH